jgi:hypothetical protein
VALANLHDPKRDFHVRVGVRYTTDDSLRVEKKKIVLVKRDVTEEERERRKRMQQAEAIKGGDTKQLERIRWERWNKVPPPLVLSGHAASLTPY